jgi:hypothetical protein
MTPTTEAPGIDAILNAQNINGFEFPGGTDKQTLHSYGPVYEQLLSPLKGKNATVLEVGVQLGGSLLLWHDFLPDSVVIGLDNKDAIDPSIMPRMDPLRCAVLFMDAYDNDTISKVKQLAPNGIDFAIDDGPHSLASQQRFLELYLPLLNDGGIAVIEDIQDYSWFDSLTPLVGEEFTYEIIDLRGAKGRYDDLMLVVYK